MLEAEILAAKSRGKIVKATIQRALKDEGVQERRMMLQHYGFIPIPKHSVVNVYGHKKIDARKQELNVVKLEPPDEGIRRLTNRFNEMIAEKTAVPALPAAPPEIDSGTDDENDEDEQ